MKKSTLSAITNYFNANAVPAELADAIEDVRAEFAKGEEKAQANRDLYNAAKVVVMGVLSATKQTVTEIYDACADDLPDGFSKSKLQYAIREMWADEVVRHDEGKNPYTYTKR